MEPVVLIIISVLVGLVVGTLSGMLGIGGGTLLVPVFKLGYGLSALGSTATSLFTIIPTSITGAITHIRNRTCLPKLGVAAGLGGAITSPLGVWLASISPEWATMIAAALIILYSAYTMFRKAIKLQRAQRMAKGRATTEDPSPADNAPLTDASLGSSAAHPAASSTQGAALSVDERPAVGTKQVLLGAFIGLFAGVMSGYVGVGGGFIMVPLFMQMLSIPMRLTSGTSLIAVMILAIPGTITQAILGNVNWVAGCFVALGAIPGATFGSLLIKRIPELALRYIFSAFLIVAAIMLVLDQFSIL